MEARGPHGRPEPYRPSEPQGAPVPYRPPEPFQPAPAAERYRPFELLGLILVVMLGFAAFFVTFLLAPVVVILVVYLMLRFMERGSTPGARSPIVYQDSLERRARLDRERQRRQGDVGGGRDEGGGGAQ